MPAGPRFSKRLVPTESESELNVSTPLQRNMISLCFIGKSLRTHTWHLSMKTVPVRGGVRSASNQSAEMECVRMQLISMLQQRLGEVQMEITVGMPTLTRTRNFLFFCSCLCSHSTFTIFTLLQSHSFVLDFTDTNSATGEGAYLYNRVMCKAPLRC